MYINIVIQSYHHHCYALCFDILKFLKKGKIQLLAIKNIVPDTINNEYTMHALYVNNGWAFDPYNQKQYPLSELIEIYDGKVYKDFSYAEIKNILYDEFRYSIHYELEQWCKENDVFQSLVEF